MGKKIRALFTFEIMGRPPEHIKTTMEELIDKLGELPGISIDRREVHEPKPVDDEEAKDLFTTFSEVEILGDQVENLIAIVFHAMPSHIEIIEPEEFGFRNFDISNLLTSLTAKLHRYDEIAKAISMERNLLVGKLTEMQKRINELEGGNIIHVQSNLLGDAKAPEKTVEKKEMEKYKLVDKKPEKNSKKKNQKAAKKNSKNK
jgi:hypothetical protein